MKKNNYDKLFEHITELAVKYSMGNIPHQTMHEGLKKLLGEYVEHKVEGQKRAAFWRGILVCAGFFVLLMGLAYAAWRQGWLSSCLK